MRTLRILFVVAISLVLTSFVFAQDKSSGKMMHKKAGISDAAYTAQAISAAPKAVAKDAGVIRMDADGKMKTLRESKNGFTCMIIATDKCATTLTAWNFLVP